MKFDALALALRVQKCHLASVRVHLTDADPEVR